mgnify:CR=1 FL=1
MVSIASAKKNDPWIDELEMCLFIIHFALLLVAVLHQMGHLIYNCHRSEEIHGKIYAYHTCRRCIRLVLARTNNVVKAKLETIMETLRVEQNLERKTLNAIIVLRRGILRNIVMP